MTREEVLKKLWTFKMVKGEKYQITRIGLFGSFAKGDVRRDSDVDIIVEQKKPDLFILGSIKVDLEKELGRPVDIIRLRKGMNPFLKKRIEQEAIYV